MPTFEQRIDVAALADRVFEFMTDTSNWPRTNPGLADLETVEGTENGSRMRATYRVLGLSNRGDLELTVLEPGVRSLVSFESPGLAGEIDYRFSETDGVTTVVQSADYEFGDSLLDRVIEPVAKRFNERQFRHTLENVKELVEAEMAAEADDEPMPVA